MALGMAESWSVSTSWICFLLCDLHSSALCGVSPVHPWQLQQEENACFLKAPTISQPISLTQIYGWVGSVLFLTLSLWSPACDALIGRG